MHTDDDIFESLDIDEGTSAGPTPSADNVNAGEPAFRVPVSGTDKSHNTSGIQNRQTGRGTDGYTGTGRDQFRAAYGNTSDDIFETLDMEDRIFDTAINDADRGQTGRNQSYPAADLVYTGRGRNIGGSVSAGRGVSDGSTPAGREISGGVASTGRGVSGGSTPAGRDISGGVASTGSSVSANGSGTGYANTGNINNGSSTVAGRGLQAGGSNGNAGSFLGNGAADSRHAAGGVYAAHSSLEGRSSRISSDSTASNGNHSGISNHNSRAEHSTASFLDEDLIDETEADSTAAGKSGLSDGEWTDAAYGTEAAAAQRGTNRGSLRGHHSPRELNTADTSVDAKKISKDRETKKKSKIRKIVICTILELFTLAAIFVYGYFLRTWNLIARPEIRMEAIENNNISVEKKKEMEGYWNIAVFGVDARNDSVVERGLNSDVIMIVSINKDTGDIKLVSVFRDTYINISEKNSYNKINAAYAIGGPEQALAALNKNLDLNIQHYVAFNWKAVADGINILGGVDNIPISKAELYYINAYITETVKVTKIGSVQLTHTGEQHLDGVQAVAYGRLRYMDSDFARTERQRNIIKAAFAKAKTAGFSVLNNIMVVCFPQVATNIDFNEAIGMAQNITQYNIADTGGFPWSRGDANIGSKGDCVIPTTLESNVVKLHEFLFGDENYTPSDAVIAISNQIKSDSGRYKEGTVIESVATDGGVIQKPKDSVSETKSPAEEDEDDDNDSGKSRNNRETIGVDEDGNYIYPTDEDGNIIVPTDSNGDVIYPTDEDGNIVRESSVARPTELSTDDVVPGDNYYDFDEEDDPDAQGPTSTTAANGNTHSTTAGSTTNPAGSHSSTTDPTNSHSSTTVNPTADGSSNNGSVSDSPGSISNSPMETTTASSSSNTANAPGETTSSSSSLSGPGSTGTDSSSGPGSNSTSGPIVTTDGPGSVNTGSSAGPG